VSHWLRRRFGLVNWFTGASLVVTTINSYTLNITVTIAYVMSSNSSPGHTAVPLELRSSSEVNSHSHILSYPLGTDHAQKTQFYCCIMQTTQKTSHMITILPVHWCADCCLAMNYKHSSYCCVSVSWGIYWAVAWQCVDTSQYLAVWQNWEPSDPPGSLAVSGRHWLALKLQSKLKLLYDQRFTANQFFLAPSPLRLMTRDFFSAEPLWS
jgi:hypothetical protein